MRWVPPRNRDLQGQLDIRTTNNRCHTGTLSPLPTAAGPIPHYFAQVPSHFMSQHMTVLAVN